MRRKTSEALDEILGHELKVLDHGFIRVVDYMGNDSAVVQAARISYGQGTKQASEDEGLISYLMRNYHTTPFEMCEIKLHVKLPMFIARQWIRHRTANINEYSARYSILSKDFYVPDIATMKKQSTTNKQGGGEAIDEKDAEEMIKALKEHSERAYEIYENMLHKGLSRELARASLPVNFYTEMYWKIDAHNFMHFIRLREHPHAQYEIRAYAEILSSILQAWMPMTFKAFKRYRKNCFNAPKELIRCLVNFAPSVQEVINDLKHKDQLSARELREFEDYIKNS